MTLLKGFAFHGYRSFYSDCRAILSPLRKINLIVGQNNSGKSNILRVVADTYGGSTVTPLQWDRPLGDPEHSYRKYEFYTIDEMLSWEHAAQLNQRTAARLRSILENLPFVETRPGGSGIGMWIGVTEGGKIDQESLDDLGRQAGNSREASNLSGELTTRSGGRLGADVARILSFVLQGKPHQPTAVVVGGIRAISDENTEEFDLNGLSIKRRLLQLQNPSTNKLEDKKRFIALQEFVRAVLDDPNITIDIPHDLRTIHVTQGERTLPIENMGTGIHEVVIIAAAATITQDSIICMEEPEVHLHPVLQRKLLRYLESSTTNQYFIATHSAHMLDSEIGSIFQVALSDGRSSVRFAGEAQDRAAICADLGYRPSDLVQTNAVLWVEGPSDRIYLKHWIEKLAPEEFIEGTHYSVMFYGGSLLSTLTPLDADEITEFISLRNLNRYMVVLMDSDRTRAGAKLNGSKQRVIEELKIDPSTGLAWVTAGYTIENYVPESVLTRAIREAHPSTIDIEFSAQERWTSPLSVDRVKVKQPSKVAISKNATSLWTEEWPLDLKKRMGAVIALIRRANSHT